MNDTTWILLACAVCVLVIHAYGVLLGALDLVYGDPLRIVLAGNGGEEEDGGDARSNGTGGRSRRRVVKKGGDGSGDGELEIDGWTLLHLFFYGVLAFLFPARWPLLFLLGVAWEAYEFAVSVRSEWWYARWQDIATNSVGIVIGLALAWSLRGRSGDQTKRRTHPPPPYKTHRRRKG